MGECRHIEIVESRCGSCGACVHELIVNAVCYYCGEAAPVVTNRRPAADELVAPDRLVRPK